MSFLLNIVRREHRHLYTLVLPIRRSCVSLSAEKLVRRSCTRPTDPEGSIRGSSNVLAAVLYLQNLTQREWSRRSYTRPTDLEGSVRGSSNVLAAVLYLQNPTQKEGCLDWVSSRERSTTYIISVPFLWVILRDLVTFSLNVRSAQVLLPQWSFCLKCIITIPK